MKGVAVFVVGDELLAGRREDRNLALARRLLAAAGHRPALAAYLPDALPTLVAAFQFARGQGLEVLCTGGIGATPDDLTRQAVAEALGRPLAVHPEGLALLRARDGAEPDALRRRLVTFPEGAELIPNPVNRIPGFSIAGIHCVPGFPEMAEPMLAWVIAHRLERPAPLVYRALRLPGAGEGKVLPVLEAIRAGHPAVRVISLPSATRPLELAVEGPPPEVDRAYEALCEALRAAGFAPSPIEGDAPSSAS